MTDLTVLTPPAGEALSLVQAKAYLRLGHAGEDGLVTDLIQGANARLEQASGLALVTRALRRTASHWPGGIAGRGARLRPGPVTTLVAVRTVDANDVVTDHTGRFRLECGRMCLRAWSMVPAVPIGGRVEIDFEAGFGAPGAVPEDLVLAVKRLVADAYSQRGLPGSRASADGLPEDVEAILDARRGARI